jgi:glycine cleavage system regulatory protein
MYLHPIPKIVKPRLRKPAKYLPKPRKSHALALVYRFTDTRQKTSDNPKQAALITTSNPISSGDSSGLISNFTGTFATSNIGIPNRKNALKKP